jgi:hypothetical protein
VFSKADRGESKVGQTIGLCRLLGWAFGPRKFMKKGGAGAFACQLLIRARGWQAEAPAPPTGAKTTGIAGLWPVGKLKSMPHLKHRVFMGFRGPKAHSNRPQNAMVCPTRFYSA